MPTIWIGQHNLSTKLNRVRIDGLHIRVDAYHVLAKHPMLQLSINVKQHNAPTFGSPFAEIDGGNVMPLTVAQVLVPDRQWSTNRQSQTTEIFTASPLISDTQLPCGADGDVFMPQSLEVAPANDGPFLVRSEIGREFYPGSHGTIGIAADAGKNCFYPVVDAIKFECSRPVSLDPARTVHARGNQRLGIADSLWRRDIATPLVERPVHPLDISLFFFR